MKPSSLSAALYVALVFASGVVVGAFGHRLLFVNSVNSSNRPPNPEEWRRKYNEEIRTRLSLSPEQFTKLQAILDETRQRFRDLRERSKPQMKAIQDEQVQKINAILDERQRAEYTKFREERERRREMDRRDRGGR